MTYGELSVYLSVCLSVCLYMVENRYILLLLMC